MMTRQFLGGWLVLLLVACAAPAGEDQEQLEEQWREQILARSTAWEEAFNAGDAAALAAIYSVDSILLPPNSDSLQGREAIESFWGGLIETIDGDLEILETVIEGDLAYQMGTYQLVDAAGQVVDQGKYIEIWRREGEQWWMSRDIFNTSLPAPESETEEE